MISIEMKQYYTLDAENVGYMGHSFSLKQSKLDSEDLEARCTRCISGEIEYSLVQSFAQNSSMT